MFSSSGAFTSPISEAKLRCNQNHSRLQTGREPEIAQRALSHGRLVLQQLPLSSKKHLTCVVGDSGEALKHRAGEGNLLWTEKVLEGQRVQSLTPVSHFTFISALSGIFCVKSVIGEFLVHL